MKNKLLTISIPTYNRSEHLKKCLDAICPQLTNEVVVVVRDNNSNNYNFESFIKPYTNKYGVIAFKNKINIGGDANIARLFEDCDTKWLWILGDDDYLHPSAIAKVIETIKKKSSSIYIKFNADKTIDTHNIQEFCNSLTSFYSFSNNFFISESIHNISLTKKDLIYNYTFLSSKISQILRIVLHLEKNSATCSFLETKIIEEHGEIIGWNHKDLIIPHLATIDYLRTNMNLYKNNILKNLSGISMIYTIESEMRLKEKIYYIILILMKYGLFNTTKYILIPIVKIIIANNMSNRTKLYIKKVLPNSNSK